MRRKNQNLYKGAATWGERTRMYIGELVMVFIATWEKTLNAWGREFLLDTGLPTLDYTSETTVGISFSFLFMVPISCELHSWFPAAVNFIHGSQQLWTSFIVPSSCELHSLFPASVNFIHGSQQLWIFIPNLLKTLFKPKSRFIEMFYLIRYKSLIFCG